MIADGLFERFPFDEICGIQQIFTSGSYAGGSGQAEILERG
ncbi:hypothetical protein FHT70_000322 [Rhizobium sp. BK049]|nr:hypothetical protein [Rhizobium sp. BK049]